MLVVSVIQRSKDIGILRAMGTSQGQILRVFLLQGGLLGFVGSLFGAAVGAVALVVFWHAYMRQADGSELFPLILEPSLFIIAVLLAARDRRRRGGRAGAAGRQTRSGGGDPWLTKSVLRLEKICKAYNVGTPVEIEVLHDIDLVLAARRVPRADRAVGIRQEHAAQHHRPARPADVGPALHRRPGNEHAG